MSSLCLLFVLMTWFCVSETTNNGERYSVVLGLDSHTFPEFNEQILNHIQDFFKTISQRLFLASRKQICFENILILVPPHWTNITELNNNSIYQHSDIRVLNLSNIGNGESFLTVQPRRCGIKGDYMIVSSKIFESKSSSDIQDSFLREWMRLRYGIFPENGFRNDRFPLFYYSEHGCTLTGCTEKPRINASCCFPGKCNSLQSIEKIKATSSIMDSNLKAETFCDDETHPHNEMAPTLQNTLCEEKSTWEVITSSDYFQKNECVIDKYLDPQITVKRSPDALNVVFLLDPSKPEVLKTFEPVLLKLMKYLVKDEIQIGMVSMKSNSTMNLIPFTENNQKNLTSTLRRFKNSEFENVALETVLQSGIQILESQYGFLITLTTEDIAINTSNVDDILKNVSGLHVISLGKTENPLRHLQNRQKLSWHHIGIEDKDCDLTSRNTLFNVLMNLFNYHKPSFQFQWKQISWEDSYTNSVSDDVILYEENVDQLETRIDVCSEFYSRIRLTVNRSEESEPEYDDITKAYKAVVPLGKRFTYNFTVFESINGRRPTMIATVWLKEKHPKISAEISVDQFLSKIENRTLTVLRVVATKLTEEIKITKVVVDVKTPDNIKIPVELFDNGNGDPDNLRGDDVYSRYFCDFSEHSGIYEISGRIHFNYKNTDQKLFIVGPSFYSKGQKTISLPPNKIRDFYLKEIDSKKGLTFSWTAPGQYLDSGQVSRYELHCNSNRSLLNSNSHSLNLIFKFNGSKALGEEENYSVDFKNGSTIIFCAIRAFNKLGSDNGISNIVAILMAPPENMSISTESTSTGTDPSLYKTTAINEIGAHTTVEKELKSNDIQVMNIAIICGCVLGFVTLVIAITVCFVCYQKAKAAKATNQPQTNIGQLWNPPPQNVDIIRGYNGDEEEPIQYGGPQPINPNDLGRHYRVPRSPQAIRNHITQRQLQNRYPPNIGVVQASNPRVPYRQGNANLGYDSDSTESLPPIRGRIDIISKV